MKKLLTFGAAAIASAAFFGSAAPAAAGSHEYCRRDINEYGALSCSFARNARQRRRDEAAIAFAIPPCRALATPTRLRRMSAGPTPTRRLLASIIRNSRGARLWGWLDVPIKASHGVIIAAA